MIISSWPFRSDFGSAPMCRTLVGTKRHVAVMPGYVLPYVIFAEGVSVFLVCAGRALSHLSHGTSMCAWWSLLWLISAAHPGACDACFVARVCACRDLSCAGCICDIHEHAEL